jgi:hypothetical protein
MDNMTSHFDSKDSAAQVPDLDWLSLKAGEYDNIPTENHVEIIPQLQEQWSKKEDRSTTLAPNTSAAAMPKKEAFSKEDIEGVIKSAKLAAMQGTTGKMLAKELEKRYPASLIVAAKDELVKVAGEQGLLGNVYVDLTPFSSCKEASNKLGSNKIRSAQYVVGECKHVCATHHTGYCSELKKTVVEKMSYDEDTLKSYENHLKVVGKLASDEKIDSKDALQEALLKSSAPKADNKAGDTEFSDPNKSFEDLDKKKEAFEKELKKKEASIRDEQASDRFESAKPVLAFIQDNMLKGKIGDSLKEVIAKNLDEDSIRKYSSEINKMVSLQGLLGNVYVDVSYYKNASDAINSIKKASTSPQYLVQTVTAGEFDDTLSRVSKATGCAILPQDGKIDTKIAHSYIDDIMFSDRIALDKGAEFKTSIEAGENALGIIREAFIATLSHKKSVKTAGAKMTLTSKGERKASVDTNHLKTASYKAIENGVSVEDLEVKLASFLPAVEAAGMVDEVLSNVKEVSANVMTNCTTQKYAFRSDTVIIPTEKCAGCILNNKTSCLKSKLAFKNSSEVLQYSVGEADSNREDMKQDYEISDDSGMNIALRKNASDKGADVDTTYNTSGIDSIMGDL